MASRPRFSIRMVVVCLGVAGSAGCRVEASREPSPSAWMAYEALPQQAPTSDGVFLWYDATATWRMRDERAFDRFRFVGPAAAYVDDVYEEELRAVVTRKSTAALLGGETAPSTQEVRAGRAVPRPVAPEVVWEIRRRVAARLDEVHIGFRDLKLVATAGSARERPETSSPAGAR